MKGAFNDDESPLHWVKKSTAYQKLNGDNSPEKILL